MKRFIVFALVLLLIIISFMKFESNEVYNSPQNSNVVIIGKDFYFNINNSIYRSKDASNLTDELIIDNVIVSNLQEYQGKLFFILTKNEDSSIYYLDNDCIKIFDMDLDLKSKISNFKSVKMFDFFQNYLIVLNEDKIIQVNILKKEIQYVEIADVKSIYGVSANYMVYSKRNNYITKADMNSGFSKDILNFGSTKSNSNYLVNNDLIFNKFYNGVLSGVYRYQLDVDETTKLCEGQIINLSYYGAFVYFIIDTKVDLKIYKSDFNFQKIEEVEINIELENDAQIVNLDDLYILQSNKLIRLDEILKTN